MKRKVLSITSAFFFVLAVLLIGIGIHFGARSLLVLEQLFQGG